MNDEAELERFCHAGELESLCVLSPVAGPGLGRNIESPGDTLEEG